MTIANFADMVTLQAFSLALLRLEMPMSQDLQQAGHQIGVQLADRQPKAAAESIRHLISQQSHLNNLYNDEYQQLSHHYRLQQRAESFFGSDHSTFSTWDSIVLPLLITDDVRATAKELLHRLKLTQNQAPTDAHVFLTALEQALIAADAQLIVILHAIDQQLLTVEDLAYYVKLPIEQVQAMVQHLWDEGYIDLAKRRLPVRVLAMFASHPPNRRLVDRSMTFSLTPKGHFHLHPVKPSQREGTAQ